MSHQSVHLRLTPSFNHPATEITSLSCRLTLPLPASSSIPADSPLLSMPTVVGITPTQCYDDSTLRACDGAGDLPIEFHDADSERTWVLRRPTHGRQVVIEFLAKPRRVGPETPVGTRIDLRADQGGLAGCGLGFIPKPIYLGEGPCEVLVEWMLDSAPDGVKAVWTFGEGDGPHRHVGGIEVLQETYFAVGNIEGVEDKTEGFGFYWFGVVPSMVREAGESAKRLFRDMSAFFADEPSLAYRIFVRCATPARGFGGTAFRRSYCLEYDEAVASVSRDDLNQLLAHEMVHNWPLIGKLTDSDQSQKIYDWYNEGIANYYSVEFPNLCGIIKEKEFVKQVNDMLTEYYTHPLIDWSNKSIADAGWSSFYGITLPYVRGFTYFLKVAAQLYARESLQLDDIVRILLHKKENGQRCSEADWMKLVERCLGDAARTDFHAMAAGQLIVPEKEALGPNCKLVRRDKERMDLCMDPASFGRRQVSGLKAGSRAALAGLRDDDQILQSTFIWQCQAHFEQRMVMKVRRNDREMELSYWPRAWDKVEAWEYVLYEDDWWLLD